ncbi:MAG: hypothetical protein ACP5SI_04835 [Chloroflexia bacterium]
MRIRVETSPRSLEAFRPIVGDIALEEIRTLAAPLRGARVGHINATAYGGGVAEILRTLVLLMQDVGLEAEWQVIRGADEFFQVTKACHNGLQGMEIPLSEEIRRPGRNTTSPWASSTPTGSSNARSRSGSSRWSGPRR